MLRSEKGQSLIEVLVVLVVAAMMIVALITIILSSLKNAQFAQNQTQATKLAQDTIDQIRILRDNNKNNTISFGTELHCFSALWGNSNTSNDPLNCGGVSSYCYYQLITNGSTTMSYLGNSAPLTKDNLSGGFYRQIKVSQPDPVLSSDRVNLMVSISWKDSSGEHNSNLETILTKPNYDCVE